MGLYWGVALGGLLGPDRYKCPSADDKQEQEVKQ